MTAALIVGIPAGVGRAIERHHIMSAEPTPGVEVAIKKGGSLDQALQDAAQHDPSLAIVMGTSLEKARDDAIKMNPEKLDPDGDGILTPSNRAQLQPKPITSYRHQINSFGRLKIISPQTVGLLINQADIAYLTTKLRILPGT